VLFVVDQNSALLIISNTKIGKKEPVEELVEFFFSRGKPKKKIILSNPESFSWKLNNQTFELIILYDLDAEILNDVLLMLHRLSTNVPTIVLHAADLGLKFCPSFPIGDVPIPYDDEKLRKCVDSLIGHRAQRDSLTRINSSDPSIPKEIFVVEDEKVSLKILTMQLKKYNCNITSFENGSKFLKTIRDKRPDLIILDYYLPDINADHLSFWARKMYRKSEVPIIIVSGQEERAIVMALLDFGVSNYLAKPVKLNKLSKLLARYKVYLKADSKSDPISTDSTE
jgi:CheY-like chemotaxis protein